MTTPWPRPDAVCMDCGAPLTPDNTARRFEDIVGEGEDLRPVLALVCVACRDRSEGEV